MSGPTQNDPAVQRPWIAPEIRELDVRASAQLPARGADVGGNPSIDCQRS